MAKKTKDKKTIKPSLEGIKAMDEIEVIDMETILANIDIPICSDDEQSKFIASEEYEAIARTNDIKQTCFIDNVRMRIPQIFNNICFKPEDDDIPNYVVVKDKGTFLRFTCYNYLSVDKNVLKLLGGMLNADLDDSWIWTYETSGREVQVKGAYDKNGEYFTSYLANGKLELNYKFPAFAPVLLGLKDKRQGKWQDFEHKVRYIKQDTSWRPRDIEILYDRDIEYSDDLIKKVLAVDACMAIIRYIFTVHLIANNKRYKSIVNTETVTLPNDMTRKQHNKAKGKIVYNINVGQFNKQAKKVRVIRARKEAIYKTDEWEVRGHKRTYKDGRTIWVRPAVKKRNEKLIVESEARVGKKYKVKM